VKRSVFYGRGHPQLVRGKSCSVAKPFKLSHISCGVEEVVHLSLLGHVVDDSCREKGIATPYSLT
jgi:hypothetical protein